MKGSILQNQVYCSKQGELVHFGLPFIGKGGRRDLQVYYDLVKTGADDLTLADHDFGTFSRTLKATDRIRLARKPARRTSPRQVILLVGESDAGKSRMANDMFPDLYKVPYSKNLWIDGYQGEKQVLFEEFTGAYPLVGTLQLFDPWQTQKFEIKHGFQWFDPDVIIVTTNIHPREWYDFTKREKQEIALRRRFSKVLYFTTKTIIKEYRGEEEIQNFWPISTDRAQQRAPPVPLNPVQQALKDGTLCHGCYVVPCACFPPTPLDLTEGVEEEIYEPTQCIMCDASIAQCKC